MHAGKQQSKCCQAAASVNNAAMTWKRRDAGVGAGQGHLILLQVDNIYFSAT